MTGTTVYIYMENNNYCDMEDKPNIKVGLIKLLVDLRSSGGEFHRVGPAILKIIR